MSTKKTTTKKTATKKNGAKVASKKVESKKTAASKKSPEPGTWEAIVEAAAYARKVGLKNYARS